MNTYIIRIIAIITLVLGAIGIDNYTLLRWIVFLGSTYLLYRKKSVLSTGYFYGYIAIAIVFNPILPIYIYDRVTWIIIDIAAALFLSFDKSKLTDDRTQKKGNKDDRNGPSIIEEYESLSSEAQKKRFLNDRFRFDAWQEPGPYEYTEEMDREIMDSVLDEYGGSWEGLQDLKPVSKEVDEHLEKNKQYRSDKD